MKENIPKAIDVHTRNMHVYESLIKQGLCVIPIYNDQGNISYFLVSTGLIDTEKIKGNSS